MKNRVAEVQKFKESANKWPITDQQLYSMTNFTWLETALSQAHVLP